MFTETTVMGYLGADPELRYTQDQTPVATMNVATSEVWNNKEGQKQEHTEWHRCVLWGRQAENANKYLKKGSPVFLKGQNRTRKWEDKNGVERYTTEIKVSLMKLMPSGQSQGTHAPHPADQAQDNQQMPPPNGGGSPQTPGIDDIPF